MITQNEMKIYCAQRGDGKTLYNEFRSHLWHVQHYLQAYNNWKYPKISTTNYNSYYHEGKHERRFNRCYHARMAAKYMVKYYLLWKQK